MNEKIRSKLIDVLKEIGDVTLCGFVQNIEIADIAKGNLYWEYRWNNIETTNVLIR
jgi:hypothetical protein